MVRNVDFLIRYLRFSVLVCSKNLALLNMERPVLLITQASGSLVQTGHPEISCSDFEHPNSSHALLFLNLF